MTGKPTSLRRLAHWIATDCDLSERQMRFIRIVFGLFAVYAGTIFLEQYFDARSGGYFNLPMIADLPLLPSWAHQAVICTVPVCGVLIVFNRFVSSASLILSLCFAYILVGDHFGFRHVWVLLANVYLIFAVIAIRRRLYLGESEPQAPCAQQYALFAMRLYIAMAYLFAALAKVDAGFLSGAVLRQLVENWGDPSLIKQALDAVPGAYSVMAISALVVEVVLPITLMLPRLRPIGYLIGFGFHNAVPFLGWVGHSLNFYFVGSYLFFCGQPQAAERSTSRLSQRLNLTSIHWRNPLIGWYLLIWLLMLILKIRQSPLYVGVFILSLVALWRWIGEPGHSEDNDSCWRNA